MYSCPFLKKLTKGFGLLILLACPPLLSFASCPSPLPLSHDFHSLFGSRAEIISYDAYLCYFTCSHANADANTSLLPIMYFWIYVITHSTEVGVDVILC